MKIEKDIPKIDLPRDFVIGELSQSDIGLLNLYANYPCRLKAEIFVLCLRGEFEASINMTRHSVKPLSFVSILPGTIFQIHRIEGDVEIYFMGFSSDFVSRTNIVKPFMDILFLIRESPVIRLKNETGAMLLKDYFSLLERTYSFCGPQLKPNVLNHLHTGVLLGVNAIYKDKTQPKTNISKAEQTGKNFERLVMQNYTTQRNVAWYAQKLGITQAHLSTTVKQTTGKTCVEIISSMVIMDAKAQLKSTDLSIHDIAYSLNFANMSFFGKYFKRHVGMGPLEYRNS